MGLLEVACIARNAVTIPEIDGISADNDWAFEAQPNLGPVIA
jgi:hypothetical protein